VIHSDRNLTATDLPCRGPVGWYCRLQPYRIRCNALSTNACPPCPPSERKKQRHALHLSISLEVPGVSWRGAAVSSFASKRARVGRLTMVPRAHNAMLQGFQPRIALSVPAPLFSLILVHPLPLADAPRFRCRSLFTGRLRVLVLIANHLFPNVPGLVHVFVLVSVISMLAPLSCRPPLCPAMFPWVMDSWHALLGSA